MKSLLISLLVALPLASALQHHGRGRDWNRGRGHGCDKDKECKRPHLSEEAQTLVDTATALLYEAKVNEGATFDPCAALNTFFVDGFASIDLDSDTTTVTLDEVKNSLDDLATEMLNAGFDQALLDSITEDDVEDLFKLVDISEGECDGKITISEICTVMTTYLDAYVPPNIKDLLQQSKEYLDEQTKADLLCAELTGQLAAEFADGVISSTEALTLLQEFVDNDLGGGITLTASDVAYLFFKFDTDATPGISPQELCNLISSLTGED